MTDMTVANTIREQLGHKALFMLGAKNLAGGENYLTFKVGRGAKNANGTITHIRIELTADDLYKMEFIWCRGTKAPKTRAAHDGIYADMMHQIIRDETGMATSL